VVVGTDGSDFERPLSAAVAAVDLIMDLSAVAPTILHGVIGLQTWVCDDVFPSARMHDAIVTTGGVVTDLCAPDVVAIAEAIAAAAP
jgi:hypothetical protein